MNFRVNDLGKKAEQKQSVLKPPFAGFPLSSFSAYIA